MLTQTRWTFARRSAKIYHSLDDHPPNFTPVSHKRSKLHCKKFGVCNTPNMVCYHVLYTHTFFGVQCTPLHKVCLAHQPRCVSHTYYSVSRTPTTVCLAHQPRCVSHAYYSVSLTPTMACPTHTYYGVSCTPTIVCHVRF